MRTAAALAVLLALAVSGCVQPEAPGPSDPPGVTRVDQPLAFFAKCPDVLGKNMTAHCTSKTKPLHPETAYPDGNERLCLPGDPAPPGFDLRLMYDAVDGYEYGYRFSLPTVQPAWHTLAATASGRRITLGEFVQDKGYLPLSDLSGSWNHFEVSFFHASYASPTPALANGTLVPIWTPEGLDAWVVHRVDVGNASYFFPGMEPTDVSDYFLVAPDVHVVGPDFEVKIHVVRTPIYQWTPGLGIRPCAAPTVV